MLRKEPTVPKKNLRLHQRWAKRALKKEKEKYMEEKRRNKDVPYSKLLKSTQHWTFRLSFICKERK